MVSNSFFRRLVFVMLMTSFFMTVMGVRSVSAATSNAEIQSRIEQRALAYFVENSHPVTGLTLDRAKNFESGVASAAESVFKEAQEIPISDRLASMAATGFSLAVIANAADRGLIERDVAYQYVLKTLQFSRDHVPRWKGWFLHFVDWKTGERLWESEFSTIDTALFIGGGLYAAQVFPQTEVSAIVRQLYTDLDFHAIRTDDGKHPKKLTLSMGFSPEHGFIETQWDMYAEQALLLILGLGHPTRPLPRASWLAFSRELRDGMMGFDQALFVHQYSLLFLDFRRFDDGFKNYFENSVRISNRHRQIAQSDTRFRTLREGFWGFSAGLAPGDRYEVANALHYSSTVCIGCAQGSVVFMPELVFEDMARWIDGPYGERIWGRYGLTDSLDLDQNWISEWVIGITVGPAYMSLANLDEKTSIWRLFMEVPEIQTAMERASDAGFLTEGQNAVFH